VHAGTSAELYQRVWDVSNLPAPWAAQSAPHSALLVPVTVSGFGLSYYAISACVHARSKTLGLRTYSSNVSVGKDSVSKLSRERRRATRQSASSTTASPDDVGSSGLVELHSIDRSAGGSSLSESTEKTKAETGEK
jgi:hypothetical protein